MPGPCQSAPAPVKRGLAATTDREESVPKREDAMDPQHTPAGRSNPDEAPDPATVDPTADPDAPGAPVEEASTATAAQPRDASGGMLS